MAAPQEIHLTAGGARAKAAGKPRRRRIDAARRAGPANHGAAGLGHAQGLFARSCLHRLLHPRPRQRCSRQAHRHRRPRQPCHRYCRHRHFPVRRRRRPRCHRPRPRRHHHRPRPRRHGPHSTLPSPWPPPSPPSPSPLPSPLPPLPSPLSPPPPPSPRSRDTRRLSFDRASSRRFDRCAERHGFLLDFG